MKNKINTLIFDCFGVIIGEVITDWYKDNRLKKGFIDKNLKNVLEKLDLGQFSEDDILDYFLEYDGINLTKKELRAQIDSYLKVDTDLVRAIQGFKDKGFKVVLLSNANASFFERKVYKAIPEMKELFDKIIISSEVGMIKPYNDIYEYTLKIIDSSPENVLFIDDSKNNVDGAISLGMNGFLYTDRDLFMQYMEEICVK